MNALLAKALGAIRNLFYYASEYILIVVQWKLRWFRVLIKKWKRCSAQKEVNKAYSKLGAEVFALYRGGQTDLQGMPLVGQKLKLVEEAEGIIEPAGHAFYSSCSNAFLNRFPLSGFGPFQGL